MEINKILQSAEGAYDLETSKVVSFMELQPYKISLIGKLLSDMGIDNKEKVLSQEEISQGISSILEIADMDTERNKIQITAMGNSREVLSFAAIYYDYNDQPHPIKTDLPNNIYCIQPFFSKFETVILANFDIAYDFEQMTVDLIMKEENIQISNYVIENKTVDGQTKKSKIIGIRFLQKKVTQFSPLVGQVGFIAVDAD